MGKFIVIDGLDGSGKETQSKLLKSRLEAAGHRVRMISFPMYESESSRLVRMYLGGELGEHPEDTNAYAASSFFASDRYVSYVTDWKKDIDDPATAVIANRFTTANAVHQLSKMPREKWDEFLDWLWDHEYEKLGVPRPDLVIYLEMTPEISMSLVSRRSEQTGREKDIHELDPKHLENSYAAAVYSSDKLGWSRICCYEGNEPLSIEEISRKVSETVNKKLGINI
ncbi:MAG: thymidylate kinase [Clostridia bacterium]|nr:thymidylate kinase [Clostridia bacterium]